jgi:hypothetical protein
MAAELGYGRALARISFRLAKPSLKGVVDFVFSKKGLLIGEMAKKIHLEMVGVGGRQWIMPVILAS